MGKGASRNFVNQFKNTRRQAGLEQRKIVRGSRSSQKKFLPGPGQKSKGGNPGGR